MVGHGGWDWDVGSGAWRRIASMTMCCNGGEGSEGGGNGGEARVVGLGGDAGVAMAEMAKWRHLVMLYCQYCNGGEVECWPGHWLNVAEVTKFLKARHSVSDGSNEPAL